VCDYGVGVGAWPHLHKRTHVVRLFRSGIGNKHMQVHTVYLVVTAVSMNLNTNYIRQKL
jgi:hypothetical protein